MAISRQSIASIEMRILRLSELTGIDPALDNLVQELLELESVADAAKIAKKAELTPEEFLKELDGPLESTEAPAGVKDLHALREKLVLALASHLGITPV